MTCGRWRKLSFRQFHHSIPPCCTIQHAIRRATLMLNSKEDMMKAMLDPKRDLRSATPETLARALLRPTNSSRRASTGRASVRRGERTVEKVPADQTGDGVSHPRDHV